VAEEALTKEGGVGAFRVGDFEEESAAVRLSIDLFVSRRAQLSLSAS